MSSRCVLSCCQCQGTGVVLQLGTRSSPERLRCPEHTERCGWLLLQAASSRERVLPMQRVQSPSSFGGTGADTAGQEQAARCRLSSSLAVPALRGAPRLRFGACPGGGRAAPAAASRHPEGAPGDTRSSRDPGGAPQIPRRAPSEGDAAHLLCASAVLWHL